MDKNAHFALRISMRKKNWQKKKEPKTVSILPIGSTGSTLYLPYYIVYIVCIAATTIISENVYSVHILPIQSQSKAIDIGKAVAVAHSNEKTKNGKKREKHSNM